MAKQWKQPQLVLSRISTRCQLDFFCAVIVGYSFIWITFRISGRAGWSAPRNTRARYSTGLDYRGPLNPIDV